MTDNTQIRFGIESTGDKIDWRNLNEERIDDPTITALVNEADILFIKNKDIEFSKFENNIQMFIPPFNDFLKKNHYRNKITEIQVTTHIISKKKPTKKDLILQKNESAAN
jgi:hypothetical protein